MLKSITMTPSEFIKNIPDNPIQRDTQRHAASYSKPGGPLSTFHPTHLRVAIAQTPKGKRWKLDGHTRAYLWGRGDLELPKGTKLHVDVYDVENEQEAMEYYLCFDSDSAHETVGDKLSGSMKYLKFIPHHPSVWRQCGLISALKFLVFEPKWGTAKHLSHVQLLKPWIPSLRILDAMDPFYNTVRFPSVVMAAALLSVRRDGNKALPFWQDYHDDVGTRSQKSVNGVMKANDVLQEFKNPVVFTNRTHRRGRHFNEFTNKFLFCYDQWYDGKRFALKVGTGNSSWKGMLSPKDWWETYIGDYDHPEIRQQQPLELEEE